VHPGEADGTIVGGYLTDLSLLQGAPYTPAFEGAIVFLEDDVATSPPVLGRAPTRLTLQPGWRWRAPSCSHAFRALQT
jgi:muramoyltetrapeptide carboxypeptidase